MTRSELPAKMISSQERQASVDRLCAHFAQDNMSDSELERRLDLAYAARTKAELVALERDLPDLASQPERGPPATAVPAPAPAVAIDPTRHVSDHNFMISVMGGTERKGSWTPARTLTALSVMGGATLDYREATFATPEVSLRLLTIMGSVEIIVPPGVRVEWNGIAIMGGVTTLHPSHPPGPGAPVLRVTGLVCMGSVEIVERLPGESARETRKRVKAARKARRRIGSGRDDPTS